MKLLSLIDNLELKDQITLIDCITTLDKQIIEYKYKNKNKNTGNGCCPIGKKKITINSDS